MKTLVFEGAGWGESESSGDVGNCRIRGTFTNDKGQEIYLEMTGTKTHNWSTTRMKSYAIGGFISHLFLTPDHRDDYSAGLSEHSHVTFEWNKANILNFVNSRLGCSFDAIEVRDDWCGFSPDGDAKNDFHNRESEAVNA